MSIPSSRYHKFRPGAPRLLIERQERFDSKGVGSHGARAALLRAAVVAAFAMPLALVAQPEIARAQENIAAQNAPKFAAATDTTVESNSGVEAVAGKAPVVVKAAAPISELGEKAVTLRVQASAGQALAANAANARAAKAVSAPPSAPQTPVKVATGAPARALPIIKRAPTVSKTQQAKAWPWVEKAGKALEAGNATAALTFYKSALAIDPNNPYAQSGLADALLILKRYAEAETAYRRILLAQPKDVKALRNLGEIQIIEAGKALDENNSGAALTYYQRALNYNPKDVRAQKGVADSLFSMNRYAEAATAYQKVLSAQPKDSAALRNLGEVQIIRSDFAGAEKTFRSLVAANPRDFTANYRLAQLLTWGKREAEAAPYYRRALTAQPNNGEVWTEWGEALTYQGEGETARGALTRALQLAPNSIRARLALANLLAWNGEYDEAATAYRQVLALDPKNLEAQIGLGDVLTYVQQPSEAVPAYQAALAIDGNSVPARLGLGRALVFARRYEQALSELQRAVRNQPASDEALRLLAIAQAGRNGSPGANNQAALETYRALLARQKSPVDQAQTLAQIGYLEDQDGNLNEARAAFERAIELAPQSGELSVNYAQLLIGQGEIGAARDVIEKALQREPGNQRARILQVVVENRLGNKERAIALARPLENSVPETPADALQLASALLDAGNAPAARRIVESLARNLPADPAQALQVIDAVRDSGDFVAATTLYEQFIANNPNDLNARVHLAEVLTWQQKLPAAQEQLNYVLERTPQSVPARVLLAKILSRQGTNDALNSAESELAAVLKTDPNNAQALAGSGELLSLRKKYAEAVELYRAALKVKPDNLEARLGLARNLYYARQVDEAIGEYQNLLTLSPGDNQLKLELAQVYLDRNRLSDAEALFKQVVAARRAILPPLVGGKVAFKANANLAATLGAPFRPNARRDNVLQSSPQVLAPQLQHTALRLAQATVPPANGDSSLVPQALNVESGTDDQQVLALRGLGEIRRRQGRFDEAVDYFQSALALDSTSVGARLGLAQALRGQQKFVLALEETDRVLGIAPENLSARILKAQLLSDVGRKDDSQTALNALATDLDNGKPSVEDYQIVSSAFASVDNYDAALQLLAVAQQRYPGEAVLQRAQAEILLAARRYPEATAAYDALLQADPQDTDALLGRARVFNYSDALADAETAYRRVLAQEADNSQATVELADILSRRGNYRESVALYRSALEKTPDDSKSRLELARVLRYSENYDDSLTELNTILVGDTRNAEALTERGILRGQRGQYQEGLADLKRALEIAPQSLTAQFGLAEVQSYAGQYDESIANYRAALARDPQNIKGRTELGLALSYAGRYPEALNELDAVVAAAPQNVNAQIGRASVLARARRIDESIAIYNTILKSDAGNVRARQGLAEALVYGRRYPEAIETYDALVASAPENSAYGVARARTLGYARRTDEAINALRPIVRAEPDNVEARLALAEILTNSGRDKGRGEAIDIYRAVLEAQPNNARARTGLGRVLSYEGRYKESRAELNQVLASSPQDVEALYALAETQRFSGGFFDSRDTYNRVLRLDPANDNAREGLRLANRETLSLLTVAGRRYSDSNGVRVTGISAGPTFVTRSGTFGFSAETGRFKDDNVSLRRQAFNVLLAKQIGPVAARLVLTRLNYDGAPDKNLYDLNLGRTVNSRQRYFVGASKLDVFESAGAVLAGITAQQYRAGIDLPIARQFDLEARLARYKYSDSNTRTTAGASLYYRLQQNAPTLRVGLGYVRDNTKFFSPLYYTPQSYGALSVLADYVVATGRARYGIFGQHPLTNSVGANGENRTADTLFGYYNYDASDLLELFLNGGLVRSSNFRSNDITAGATLRF